MPIKIDQRQVNIKIQLQLSVQRALLDEVDANLRTVQIDWDDEKETIYLYFYFDKEVTHENKNSASCVAGEVAGDFLPSVQVIEECIQLDIPQKIPAQKLVAFRRKE